MSENDLSIHSAGHSHLQLLRNRKVQAVAGFAHPAGGDSRAYSQLRAGAGDRNLESAPVWHDQFIAAILQRSSAMSLKHFVQVQKARGMAGKA